MMKIDEAYEGTRGARNGPVRVRIWETLEKYARIMDADSFRTIEGGGHFSIPSPVPGLGPRIGLVEELVEAGLKTAFPFTLDPRPPLDFGRLGIGADEAVFFNRLYADQERYERLMEGLGFCGGQGFTCTPYLPEAGEAPNQGEVLAWSESSAVVFANSVLQTRTNRNAAIMDLMSNLIGITPSFGLLTDAGRQASFQIEMRARLLPEPQVLGAIIGRRVVDAVFYLTGLDTFLGDRSPWEARDYLKEMGAACAAIGAVGLFHVEGVTPEAVAHERRLLLPGHRRLAVDDQMIATAMADQTAQKQVRRTKGARCFIGCPHLSLVELRRWADSILSALSGAGRDRTALDTVLFAAPRVLERFKREYSDLEKLSAAGVRLDSSCPEAWLENPVSAHIGTVTDSCKLSAFTSAAWRSAKVLPRLIAAGIGGEM